MNSGGTYFESLAEGVAQGHCNMSDVDTALLHTLGLRFQLGVHAEGFPAWCLFFFLCDMGFYG